MSKKEAAIYIRTVRLDIILHMLSEDPKLQEQLKVLLCRSNE